MTQQMTMSRRLVHSASRIASGYSAGADRPLAGYLTTMGAYSAVLGALAGAVRISGREIPADGLSPYDVLLTAAATHKISRLITKDPVTSPLRAPFASYDGTSGPAELAEDVRGHGARKTVGELVTCPFCASVWVGTGLTAGMVFVPKVTRLVMGAFAALAGADMLQFAHAWMAKATS
jgi:Protein of unknown function (DUF1360)